MTTALIRGQAFGNGILQAKNKWVENRDGSYTIERTFRALAVDWMTRCPARGSIHPSVSNAVLMARNAQQSSIPFLVDVTLTYETPKVENFTGSILPPTEYSETANAVEVPIEAHPDFATFATEANGAIFDADGKFKGWTKESEFSGYMTYQVGSITESVTTYFWSKPSSVSTLIGSIQGGWRVASGGIQRRYPYWARTINRVWSERPWNTTIYKN
jgi:hypothetical protein